MVAKVNPPPLRIPQSILRDPELNGFFNELLVIIRQLWAKAGADLILGDGLEGAPSLAFANDPGLGIYRPADNTLGITADGNNVAYFSPNGLQLFNLDPASFVYNDASGNLVSSSAINGQILIGRAGFEPLLNTITGTVNRITVTNGPGTITLSTAQDLDAGSSPTFSDITLSALTAHSFLYSGLGSLVSSTGAVTNGQLLIGSNGTSPVSGTLTGTVNQITITNGAGSITLSLPQDIHAGASPTFIGLTLSGLTANSFTYSGAGGAIASTAAPTNGQLLIGSTGAPPISANLTGTAGEIIITNGPGSITLSLDATFSASIVAITTAIQTASPINGATVVMTADDRDRLLWLSPAGTIATATITVPANATSRLGQVAMFGSAQEVTALTVNGATTIYNPPTDLLAGDLYKLVKVAANTWARLL